MADKAKRPGLLRQVRAARKEHGELIETNDGDPTGSHAAVLDADGSPDTRIVVTANRAGWDWLIDALGEEG